MYIILYTYIQLATVYIGSQLAEIYDRSCRLNKHLYTCETSDSREHSRIFQKYSCIFSRKHSRRVQKIRLLNPGTTHPDSRKHSRRVQKHSRSLKKTVPESRKHCYRVKQILLQSLENTFAVSRKYFCRENIFAESSKYFFRVQKILLQSLENTFSESRLSKNN